jgi:tetratricopeptide (TPR) repeat protein
MTKQTIKALCLLSVVIALVFLSVSAIAGSAARIVPTLQAQETGGGSQEPTKAQNYYRRGVEMMNNSRYLDAVEQFQLALDEDVDYVDAYRRLAFAYTQMGATEADYYMDALDTYEDLQAVLPPDDIDVRKNIAFVQAAMGELNDAIATYEEILEITPEDCAIWTQIGGAEKIQADRVKAEKGAEDPGYTAKIDKAIGAYTKVVKLCPDSLESYNTLGEIYFSLGRMEEAAQVYEQLLAKDDSNIGIMSRLGFIYQMGKRWDKAEPVYQELLEKVPDRVNDRKLYGNVLQKRGKHAQAAQQFQMIIDADPENNGGLYCNICMLYAFDAKDATKTIETAMRGISQNAPEQACLIFGWAKGLELRGMGHVNSGKYDRAISTYREAKLKFSSILTDSKFGANAKKQMDRLDKLIEIAEQTREKAKQQSSGK